MFFRRARREELERRGARARRRHSLWLTRAVRSDASVPRIPARRVDLGGFSDLSRAEPGRQWALRWWQDAFESID